jgi:SPP1 gp7 family putative phage head morphogenesis protein
VPLTPEAQHTLAVQHRIGLSRYSTAVVRKVLALLNRTERAAILRLAEASLTDFGRLRTEQLLAEIGAIQAAGWVEIRSRLTGDLRAMAANEIEFAQRLLGLRNVQAGIFSGAPTLEQVVAAAMARPFSGRILRDWMAGAEAATTEKVREVVRQGVVEGQTIDQMVRNLRGTKAQQFRDGVLETSRRRAETLVRTAVTHVANVAHQQTWEQHADIVEGLIWTSTLDMRTSSVCQARSEKVYPLRSGPRPPAHPNCRSVMRPKVAAIPGIAPFNPPSYQEWLRGQTAEVQDDILGPSRGALFRQGGLAVERFVDHAGKVLSLDALRQRDLAAFRQAGLE